MINLEKISGLPIELTDDFHLKFNDPLKEMVPSIRKFSDMKPVLMDQSAQMSPVREEMYYMYRDVHMPEDERMIRKQNLRYDITVLPPVMIGREFNKTVGHYHPKISGQAVAYPELYEVIHGEALFLIQKMDETTNNPRTVMAFKAKPGDKVIYPPNYAHVIVNVGKGPLVTANWVADHFDSLYEPIKKMAGMAYYVVRDQHNDIGFVMNKNYQDVPAIRVANAFENPGFGLSTTEPMYRSVIKDPASLDFLNNPHKSAVELSTITS